MDNKLLYTHLYKDDLKRLQEKKRGISADVIINGHPYTMTAGELYLEKVGKVYTNRKRDKIKELSNLPIPDEYWNTFLRDRAFIEGISLYEAKQRYKRSI